MQRIFFKFEMRASHVTLSSFANIVSVSGLYVTFYQKVCFVGIKAKLLFDFDAIASLYGFQIECIHEVWQMPQITLLLISSLLLTPDLIYSP